MDWDKTINTVGEVARKTFTLALSLILVMSSLGLVYVAALTLQWLVNHARIVLGT